jgi:vancomycin permeability regulator SanA
MKTTFKPRLVADGAPPFCWWRVGARAVALFFGLYTLLSLLGEWRSPDLNPNLWWIDLRALSAVPARLLLLLGGTLWVGFGLAPRLSQWRRLATCGATALLVAAALANAAAFYGVWARGLIRPAMPIPLSFLVACALLFVLLAAAKPCLRRRLTTREQWTSGLAFAACVVAFPLLQALFFGKTDYRRPAEVAVVFGARAYADGRPSDALADRVRTACDLYHQGLVRRLVFSGGPGDGQIHETEAMRRLALKLGVRGEDILLDKSGLNTLATARNTRALAPPEAPWRVLAVSHFFHLARIKLAFEREGMQVCTVPAKETYLLRQTPYSVLREVPAWWVYYLRSVVG